jgi:D-xylose transport system permease protein
VPSAEQVGDDRGLPDLGVEEETLTAASAAEAALAVAPELVATSVSEYLRAWWQRVRGGDTGVLPILVGLIVIMALFQTQNHTFLTAGNITNLLVQGAVFVLLGMAEIFVLILGEIDLSVGFVAGLGAVIVALLMSPSVNLPWIVAVVAGLAATTAIGALQGTLVTRLHLPSFVVTLAGLLGWEGLMIWVVDTTNPNSGGVISVSNPVVFNLVNGNMTALEGWIAVVVVVAAYASFSLVRDNRRRRNGLTVPPFGLTLVRTVAMAVAAVALLLIVDANRGTTVPLSGMPPVIIVVPLIIVGWTFVLSGTRFGRYVYAIGGNPEAARRAGVNLPRIRTGAFALAGLTAGMAGIVYESRLGSISIGIDGGTLVLFGVASAVIGGASLMGGRGKPIHALLGGIVIAAIYNGMVLMGLSVAVQYMITALVLLAALTVDRVARRGRAFRSSSEA